MADKEQLRKMLDAMINGEEDSAQVTFHSYVTDKTRDILQGKDTSQDTNSDSDD